MSCELLLEACQFIVSEGQSLAQKRDLAVTKAEPLSYHQQQATRPDCG